MAMMAQNTCDSKTAGPASPMVTLLPRNRPTPMAPPMASILSCRCVKLRRSASGGESDTAGDWSGIRSYGRQHLTEPGDLFLSVVVHERCANGALRIRQAEALHEPR